MSSIALPLVRHSRSPKQRQWHLVSADTSAGSIERLWADVPNPEFRGTALTKASIMQPSFTALTKQAPSAYGRTIRRVYIVPTSQNTLLTNEDILRVTTGTINEVFEPSLDQRLNAFAIEHLGHCYFYDARSIHSKIFPDLKHATSLMAVYSSSFTQMPCVTLDKRNELTHAVSKPRSIMETNPHLLTFYTGTILGTLLGMGWFTFVFFRATKGIDSFFTPGEALFGICGMAWLAAELILALRADVRTMK